MQLVGRDQKLAETSTTIIYDAYLVSRWWWQCNPHHANFTEKGSLSNLIEATISEFMGLPHFVMIGFDSGFDSTFGVKMVVAMQSC